MKPVLQWLFLIVFLIISLSLSVGAQEGNQGSFDTDFDIPEVDKKPYSFGAKSEVSENIKDYDKDSLLHRPGLRAALWPGIESFAYFGKPAVEKN